MTTKLYHVSPIPNLTVLEPRVSTHGKAYVYATNNLEFALLFGGKDSAGDFDGMYGIGNDDIPYFFEAYEGALKRRFDGAQCYVYEVDPSTFDAGKTSFGGEVVSEKPVKVLNCKKIGNMFGYLSELNEQGKINLHFFDNDEAYTAIIDEHISDRIVRFGVLQNTDSEIYRFCKQRFPKLMSKLEKQL